MNDSLLTSLIKGRVGAAVLSLVALVLAGWGYTLDEAAQAQILDVLVVFATGISTVFALWSKIRETKKTGK